MLVLFYISLELENDLRELQILFFFLASLITTSISKKFLIKILRKTETPFVRQRG